MEEKRKDLSELQKAIRVAFNDPMLLKEALTHRSYLNENPGLSSNERLEFLGDALLSMVIAHELYKRQPPLNEGEMTQLRANLGCGENLAKLALQLNLGEYFYLGKGEEKNGGREKKRNLAGAFEALIGAIFIDQGLPKMRKVVLQQVLANSRGGEKSFKSQLQEKVQAQMKGLPRYRVVGESGPNHDPEFTVEVKAGGKVLGRGKGKSKKEASEEAARAGLERL
jgi:ribonuclease-3